MGYTVDTSVPAGSRLLVALADTRRWLPLWVGTVLATAVVVSFVRWNDQGDWMWDLEVYRRAGAALLAGGTPYGGPPEALFTYTPFAAVVLSPLALLPQPLAGLLWTVLLIVVTQAVVWKMLAWLEIGPIERRRAIVIAFGVVGAFLDPVYKNLMLGQVNLIILLVVLVDLAASDRNRWKGVGIGVMAGLKLEPALFILYLLLTRRFRAAAMAVGAFAATVLAGIAVLPSAALRYWGGYLLDVERVGFPQNAWSQSALSVLTRWAHTEAVRPVWLLVCALVVVAGAVLAVRAHREGDEMRAVAVTCLVPLLVSPISWNHHFVLAIPALLLLGVRGWRSRSVGLIVVSGLATLSFALHPYTWGVPIGPEVDLRLGVGDLLLSSTYAAAVLLMLGALASRHAGTPKAESTGDGRGERREPTAVDERIGEHPRV